MANSDGLAFNTTDKGEIVDTRRAGSTSTHRQVVVLGDPTSPTGLANVTSANGLKVEVTNFPAGGGSQVEVTNFPATQPVSIASMPSTPVTGTFWPATQPVSGSVSVSNFPTSQAVTGTFWQATQPVSIAATVATRDLKDTGRQQISLNWEEVAGTANVESALTNFTHGSKNGAALSAASSYTVTAGKTLRIQSISVYVKQSSTVSNIARFRLRQAATVANTSPIIFGRVLPGSSVGAVTANSGQHTTVDFPDGLEIPAGQQITFTWLTSANTCTVGMNIVGYEY